jgi:hypothetical protein
LIDESRLYFALEIFAQFHFKSKLPTHLPFQYFKAHSLSFISFHNYKC